MSRPFSIIRKRDILAVGNALLMARRSIEKDNTALALDGLQVLRVVLCECLYPAHSNCDEIREIYLRLPMERLKQLRTKSAEEYSVAIRSISQWHELLPYAVELLDYSDMDLENATRDRRDGVVTVKKKQRGIYYTPTDVTEYMVQCCLQGLEWQGLSLVDCRFVDFSCGSGIFLLQILDSMIDRNLLSTSDEYCAFVRAGLFGVDISKYAAECTRCMILHHYTTHFPSSKQAKSLVGVLNQNIIVTDASQLEGSLAQNPGYPKRFNCIIGNPPYVGVKKGPLSEQGNLFIPFVDNLRNYSDEKSVSSLIVPLSFTYSNQSEFRKMRTAIHQDKAEWRVESYDRSPDSLFGDDVKARVCIITRRSQPVHQLFTSGLMRWTSATRAKLLSTPKKLTDITGEKIVEYIPKLATSKEWDAYQAITANTSGVSQIRKVSTSASSYLVAVKGTAYNWICAYDHIPATLDENGALCDTKSFTALFEQNSEDQYLLLALLNSTIAFWLWTVMGDGFHVTNRLIATMKALKSIFPDGSLHKLSLLGQYVSCHLKEYPTISVNKGKTITSYNHMPLLEQIKEIDKTIAAALKLDAGFCDYLWQWYSDMVSCGRQTKLDKDMEE